MRFGHSYPPPGLVRFTNVSKITNAAGTLLQISHSGTLGGRGLVAGDAADGDRYYMDFFCDGTETKLEISTYRNTDKGQYDLYVNGTLDSSSYEEYAAAGAALHREIVLTVPIVAGSNTIMLLVNGKNVASTDYAVLVAGASLQ